jgi:hypothetical protein
MNDSSRNPIDRQIKDLLARAVAQAPPPPDLEHPMPMKSSDHRAPNRNPWLLIGGVGLAAAATVAGLLVIPNLNDQTTVLAPGDTGLPDVLPPASAVPEVTPPVASLPELVAPASTSPDEVVGGSLISVVVSAGLTGIEYREIFPTEEVGQVVTEIASKYAVRGPDGNIYFEPIALSEDPVLDTGPRIIDTTTGEMTIVDVPAPAGASISLFDVADVGGRLTILYAASYDSCAGGDDPLCVTTLRTFQPDTGDSQILAERNAWEFGWQPFTVASNGIVAGAGYESVVEEPQFYNVGGGIVPTLEALGLETGYADCLDCPTAFAVDAEGTHIAWIDGAPLDQRIVITDLATGTRVEVAIVDFDRPSYLQLAGVEIVDGAVVAGRAVFTGFSESGDAPPVLVDLATGERQELTPGTIASLS